MFEILIIAEWRYFALDCLGRGIRWVDFDIMPCNW